MPGRAGWSRFTKEQVLEAIRDSGGIVSAVARKLECDWNTARKYISKWQETRDAFAAERERVLDVAETVVIRALEAGDVGVAKWLLSRLGGRRGFGDALVDADQVMVIRLRWEDEDRGR